MLTVSGQSYRLLSRVCTGSLHLHLPRHYLGIECTQPQLLYVCID